MKKTNVRTLVQLSVIIAVMLALNFMGLGTIPVPFTILSVATLHIPVIIAGCILGPKYGGFIGFCFGLLSFINNSFITPRETSFVFTPLYSLGDYHGNFGSLVICFLPRILIGVFAGLLFKGLISKGVRIAVAGLIAGVVGSLTNTLLVMGGIALIFGDQFLSASNASEALLVVIGATIVTNGIPEAIAAALCTAAIVTPLITIQKRNNL